AGNFVNGSVFSFMSIILPAMDIMISLAYCLYIIFHYQRFISVEIKHNKNRRMILQLFAAFGIHLCTG
ncbi:hypothetical protein ACJX0J_021922, partial [Zea mays]